ncbi:hypothetical protein Bbelb_043400 [Branchiostoma belcheri]|nr:hypothetical protein Bbelb_043400 [Branchiostoma belcheri]
MALPVRPPADRISLRPSAVGRSDARSGCRCNFSFFDKASLDRHLIQVHKEQPSDGPDKGENTTIQTSKTRMLKHLEDDHDMRLSSSTHRFDTERDFLDWKEREERNNLVQFSKQSGSNFGKDTRYSYYICEHDGSDRAHRAHWQPARLSTRRNKKGRVKTGHVCPARMLVKSELNSSVLRVTYISTHNHEPRPHIPSTCSRRTCSRTTPRTRRTGKPKSRGKKVASSVSQATRPSTAHAEDNNAALFIAEDLENEDMDSDSESGAAGSEVSMLEETRGYLAELIGMVQNEQVQRTVLPQIHDVLKKAVYQCKAIKAQAASASSVVQLYQPEPVLRQPFPGQREFKHDYYCM